MSSLAAQPSWLLRPTLSKLAGTPKGSGSDDKKYTALVRKGGGDSTDVISRFGPYWPTVSELAQIGDLFTQAKPCRESWKRGSNSKNLKEADSTLRSSQAVPHPSTNRALCCLTSEVERDPVHSTRYGRRRKYATAHAYNLGQKEPRCAIMPICSVFVLLHFHQAHEVQESHTAQSHIITDLCCSKMSTIHSGHY